MIKNVIVLVLLACICNIRANNKVGQKNKLAICEQKVAGIIRNIDTQKPVKNATIILLDEEGNEIKKIKVGKKAKYLFVVECNKNYQFMVIRKGFEMAINIFTTNDNYNKEHDIDLIPEKREEEPLKRPMQIPDKDICQQALNSIPQIYFEEEDYQITEDSSFEIFRVIDILKKCMGAKVEVAVYKDSRGEKEDNLRLTQARADAIVDFIIQNSYIDSDRIQGVGYGESVLLNKCSDNIRCTEKEHQKNNRVYFLIL